MMQAKAGTRPEGYLQSRPLITQNSINEKKVMQITEEICASDAISVIDARAKDGWRCVVAVGRPGNMMLVIFQK